jgi:hypothetical protein
MEVPELHTHVSVWCGAELHSGFVLCADHSVLVLQTDTLGDPDLFDVVYIRTNNISKLEHSPQISNNLLKIPKISTQQAQMKVNEASRAELEKQMDRGVGVSIIAQVIIIYIQNIYNQIQKNYPVKWKGDIIIVMDEISIENPYSSASCKKLDETNPDDSVLNRVKLMLDRLRVNM